MPMPRDESSAPHSDAERQILDDPDELFDLVDESDRVVGQVRRGEAHRNPAFIHRSVQILIFASDGRLLLQRRSTKKDLVPRLLLRFGVWSCRQWRRLFDHSGTRACRGTGHIGATDLDWEGAHPLGARDRNHRALCRAIRWPLPVSSNGDRRWCVIDSRRSDRWHDEWRSSHDTSAACRHR